MLKVLVMYLIVGVVVRLLSKASFFKGYRKEGLAKENQTEIQIKRSEEAKRQVDKERSKYDNIGVELAKLKEEYKVKEIEGELVKEGEYRAHIDGVRYFGVEEDKEAIRSFAKFWGERGVKTVGAWRGKVLKDIDEEGYSIVLYVK